MPLLLKKVTFSIKLKSYVHKRSLMFYHWGIRLRIPLSQDPLACRLQYPQIHYLFLLNRINLLALTQNTSTTVADWEVIVMQAICSNFEIFFC